MRDLGTVGLWLVREYSSRRSKVCTGYGFWIDSFRPFRNLRWTKIRKIRSIRVFELEDSSIFIASVWFKILYSLYAIRRHKFLRSHNRDTIGEISILDSEWANEMSKAFSYLIDSNRWSVGNRTEYREVLCRVPRSYRWFSRWFNAFRPIVNSALI